MKIRWLGHAAFLITSDKGIRIITDPYKSGGELKYAEINEPADIVTVSHEHFDHNNASSISGHPQIFRGPESREIKGIKFSAISAFHDTEQGKLRNDDTIICIDINGMRLCHLGDLGHLLSEKQITNIGKVDILFIPVGGYYTIDAAAATKVVDSLKPRVTIPMHVKNERCTFPLTTIDEFVKNKKNVTIVNGTEVELNSGTLPTSTQIFVLRPAL